MREVRGEPAGLVSRAVAAAVDAFVVGALGAFAHLVPAVARMVVSGPPLRAVDLPAWLSTAGGVILALGYAAGSWATTGRTAGNQLMGLRVCGRDGRLLGGARALLRAGLCLLFPLGLLAVPLNRRRASVQDYLVASTVVYDTRPR